MPDWRTLSRRRGALIALVVLAYAAFLTLKIAMAHGDLSTFVVAGDRFFDAAALDTPVKVLPHSFGYDGQFVYRLALDPFTGQRTAHGITLDTPALRAQRIGVPILTHVLSFGSPRLVPAALIIVNLAGIALLTWAATGVALFYRRPPWHGLVIALYPGLLLSLARDTTEIVSTALALTAVLLALRGRAWAAAAVACGAVLTRETTLLYLMGFGIVIALAAMRRLRGDPRIAAFLLPVAVLVGWQLVLVHVWGQTSFSEVGGHDLGWPPLRSLIGQTRRDLSGLGGPVFRFSIAYSLVARAFLIAQVALVAMQIRRPIDWRLVLGWAPYVVLAALFTDDIWVEPPGYLRIMVDLYATGCLLLLATPGDRALRRLFALTVPMWLLTWAA